MKDELSKFGKVKENVDLKNYNTYKVSVNAKYLVEVKNVDSLNELIKYLKKNKIKYLILGNGSNVVLPEKDLDGVIIRLNGLNKIEIDDDEVYVEAGVMLPKLVNESVSNCLAGLEWASGIPGTVGGAVVGNAGAYLSDIFSFIIDIDVLENGEVKTIKKSDVTYSYRHTSFKDNKDIIVLAVRLKLNKGNADESQEIMKNRLERRIKSQPLNYPNAGSVFRNPEGDYAGRLIEECGLKGKRIGGAMVSEKHANFIINYDNATAKDIRDLIKLVHDEVLKKEKVDLIIEQELIDWR
ncbi:MAG: UDP-N-acetylmuramate dehydrogenase [Bacilli bacterium]|nr:UDP-N-acetylmuramate dehydrogenase [Bacilli bacterium]